MNFEVPIKGEFTVYSKSGCVNCNNVKKFLKEKNLLYKEINCDEYLLECKEEFLEFIQNLCGKEQKIFPMVFDNKIFIGGYSETKKFVEKMLDFETLF
jgi:glutaredoxin